jgi:hypothetical protein
MEIPYGRSNFEEIRRKGYFYVDKTPFLPLLESSLAGYPLFLRPRRFGKSTFLSLLEHYYDLGRKEQYDELFKGLWIHEHPTAERNSYLMLAFDFSDVATDGGQEALRRTFFGSVRSSVLGLLLQYRERLPPLGDLYQRLEQFQDAETLLGELLAVVSKSPHKIYVLIDEYDHFANRLLSEDGAVLYEEAILKRTGFVRTFYAALKRGTRSAIARMFITGVTPLMLDDMSSGFNVAKLVSNLPAFQTLAGFTRADVERGLKELLESQPALAKVPELGDRHALLDALSRYYDGYRFSEGATERVFNSDMVLYFLGELSGRKKYPPNMLDRNVRTEYSHLQRIGVATGMAAPERREILETVLGEGSIRSDLVEQFGVKSLASRAPYVSLLYYLGMLTLKEAPRDSEGYHLEIPNRVIRELQWEHLAHTLQDQAHLPINLDDINTALAAMAVRGDIAPFLELFHAKVLKVFGVKDTRKLDEKTIKLLFMMYVSLGRAFHPLSEKELAQGYCDLFLGASKNVADARYSWLLEFKYLPTSAKPPQIEAAFTEAQKQVERYASDPELLPILLEHRELRAGMLVFVGTKKPLFRAWPAEAAALGANGKVRPANGNSRNAVSRPVSRKKA